MLGQGIDGMLAADKHPSLTGAAERLAQTLRDLFAAYKEVLAKPGDKAALQRLQAVRQPLGLAIPRQQDTAIPYIPIYWQAMAAVEQAAARMADLSAAAAMDPITADAMAVHDSLRDVRAAATAGNANATSAACQAVAEAVARLNGDLDDDSRKRLQAALANLANKMKVHISHQTADFIQWTDVFFRCLLCAGPAVGCANGRKESPRRCRTGQAGRNARRDG